MKNSYTIVAILIVSNVALPKVYGQDALPVLKGPYLGQTPPGSVAEVFAQGIVTSELWEYGIAMSPDMKELYVLKDDADEKTFFLTYQNKNNQWRKSVISRRVGQPFISPDGQTMHLGKRYKTRTATGWSALKTLGTPFEEIRIMRLTASAKRTYVLDEVGSEDGDGVIRYSRLLKGKREAPKPFGKEINTGTYNAHPFIAPDESYLIWDGRREGGFGHSDLYISFRKIDGSWGEAINLGETVNTSAWDAAAMVSPDGNYLFFNRMVSQGNVDIFWISADIIETLRPK